MPTEADLGDVTRADAAVVHHQAVVVVLRNPKLDQFGCSLTSFNETTRPKQKAAEKKRMFQPPSEQPTARDDDEVGNPPGKKMKKIFSVLKDVQGWYKKRDLLETRSKRIGSAQSLCSVEGCPDGPVRRGVCRSHGANND